MSPFVYTSIYVYAATLTTSGDYSSYLDAVKSLKPAAQKYLNSLKSSKGKASAALENAHGEHNQRLAASGLPQVNLIQFASEVVAL